MDMCTCTPARVVVVGAIVVAALSGCHGRAPTSATPPSSPAPVFVTAVQPNAGGTNGTTNVTITGAGFEPGALVTLGTAAAGVSVVSSTTITATVPAHAAGVVDVIVTNASGGSGRISRGFTYLPPASVTAILPDAGSTDGGTVVTIAGVGFHPTTRVSVGGARMQTVVYQDSIFFATPPHAAGAVDVVIDNGVAPAFVLAGGFTYAPPGTFDFNGVWEGGAGAEEQIPLQITIHDDVVTRVSCGVGDLATFTTAIPVREGSFSSADGNAGTISGRIVSRSAARGSIDTAQCSRTSWYARKR